MRLRTGGAFLLAGALLAGCSSDTEPVADGVTPSPAPTTPEVASEPELERSFGELVEGTDPSIAVRSELGVVLRTGGRMTYSKFTTEFAAPDQPVKVTFDHLDGEEIEIGPDFDFGDDYVPPEYREQADVLYDVPTGRMLVREDGLGDWFLVENSGLRAFFERASRGPDVATTAPLEEVLALIPGDVALTSQGSTRWSGAIDGTLGRDMLQSMPDPWATEHRRRVDDLTAEPGTLTVMLDGEHLIRVGATWSDGPDEESFSVFWSFGQHERQPAYRTPADEDIVVGQA